MISLDQYWMGRDEHYPPGPDTIRNATELLEKVNRLISYAPLDMIFIVSSGYRPHQINALVKGAAKGSLHLSGNAVDFADAKGEIDAWCMANLDRLEECGIYLESPSHTVGWSHWQQVSPKSGKRVFIP